MWYYEDDMFLVKIKLLWSLVEFSCLLFLKNFPDPSLKTPGLQYNVRLWINLGCGHKSSGPIWTCILRHYTHYTQNFISFWLVMKHRKWKHFTNQWKSICEKPACIFFLFLNVFWGKMKHKEYMKIYAPHCTSSLCIKLTCEKIFYPKKNPSFLKERLAEGLSIQPPSYPGSNGRLHKFWLKQLTICALCLIFCCCALVQIACVVPHQVS